ncbi:hypothetical protein P4200_33540 [Pseudomonas aeruginosa]|nr:hypothetical protein [Pseudomonas aeruginosa]
MNQVNGIDDYDNPLYQPLQDTEYNAGCTTGVHVTGLADGAAEPAIHRSRAGSTRSTTRWWRGSRSRRCSDRRVACSGC